MFGLMRRHQERMRQEPRVIAELPKPKTPARPPDAAAGGNLAGQQLAAFLDAALAEDLAVLKSMASVEDKVAHKRDELIPKYAKYVARLKAEKRPHELLGYWLVWLFDAGAIDAALEHAEWCINAGHPLPERFNSDLRFFIASQVTAWAEAEVTAGRAVEPYFGWLLEQAENDSKAWNLPDPLRGRMYRVKGLDAERAEDLPVAAAYLKKALNLGAKVKTALEKIHKKIAAAAQAPAAGAGNGVDRPTQDIAGPEN